MHCKRAITLSYFFVLIYVNEWNCHATRVPLSTSKNRHQVRNSDNNHCPDDVYEVELDGNGTTSITWRQNSDVSQPLCLNEELKVLHRKCKDNGEWTERRTCNFAYEFCPGNLSYRDLRYCYSTSKEATNFANGCNIPGNMYDPFDDTLQKYVESDKSYWIPHVVIEKDDLYGVYTVNFHEISSTTKPRRAECPTIDSTGIWYNDCRYASNHHLCIYEPADYLHVCPKNCVPAGLNSTECYCKCDDGLRGTQPKANFYYQHAALHQLMARSRNRAVCVVNGTTTPLPPTLTLKFKKRKHRLYLIVTSYDALYPVRGELVRCFRDGIKFETVRTKRLEKPSKHLGLDNKRTAKRMILTYSLEIDNMPSEYFCVARKKPDLSLIRTDPVVAYKKFKGYLYAMEIRMPSNLSDDLATYFSWKSLKLNLMRLYSDGEGDDDTYLYHVIDSYSSYPRDSYGGFAKGFQQRYPPSKVIYFRCIDKCLSEVTLLSNATIRWPTTDVGQNAYSSDVCLQESGLPLIRRCSGDFLHGAHWDNVNVTCSWTQRKRDLTKALEHYVTINETMDGIFDNVTQLSEKDLKAYDIYLLANVVEKHFLDEANASFLQIVSNVMRIDRNELQTSQMVFRSTDLMLNEIDTYLLNASQQRFPDLNETHEFLHRRTNLILQISHPFVSNVTGLAAYGALNDTFDRYHVVPIRRNTTETDFLTENLRVATYVPNELLDEIAENMSYGEKRNLQIIVTVFYNDSLFNGNNSSQRIDGSVVSVLIPQSSDDYFTTSIPMFINATTHTDCVYWDYDVETGSNSTWSDLGNDFDESVNGTSLMRCDFVHLTHFALLITSEPLMHESNDEYVYTNVSSTRHDHALDLITYVGCGLSLIGITIIFATTVIFEKFRRKPGTKILLQISLAIIGEILILQAAGEMIGDGACAVIGFMLHYIVLSKFCWMLISAYLQYNRFVRVFGPPPDQILLKSVVFGWIVPLVPSLSVFVFTIGSYQASQHSFCYPKGLTLYLAVFLPITIVVVANIIIFCMIMINVMRPKMPQRQRDEQKYQIYLGVLLFFLLGLPWMFGILAEIVTAPIIHFICMYLFCILATLQGFVLFVFYILLDKETRKLFAKKFGMRDSSLSNFFKSKSTSNLDHLKDTN